MREAGFEPAKSYDTGSLTSPFLFLKKKKSLTGKHLVFSCLPQKTKMVFFGLAEKKKNGRLQSNLPKSIP